MRKKTLSPKIFNQQSKDLRQAAKYHWEFKRRSAAYRLWWQDGAKAEAKPEGWDERFNPDLSFEELVKACAPDVKKRIVSNRQDLKLKKALDRSPSSLFTLLFMVELLPKGVEDSIDSGVPTMTIKIHFDKIRSVSALRDYVSYLIDTHYKMFLTPGVFSDDTIGKLGRSKNLQRDFEKILKAGDMRDKDLTEPHIAKILFPKDVDREVAKIKVHRLIKEYKNLVNGGYQELSYP